MTDTVTPGTEYPFAPVEALEAIEQYKRIAADRPMTKMTMPFGGDVWVIHRNQAARDMLADPRFVREPFRTGERVVPYFVDFPDFLKATVQFADPPEHTKLRRLVQKAISPKTVKAMRDSAVAFANQLIDAMIEKGPPTNLVQDYAIALPIQMLSNLLGVPPEDREEFERWSHSTLSVAGMTEEEVGANMMELAGYMGGLIAQRRAEPRDDLLSQLAAAKDKDDSLSDDEILTMAILLIVGGFDNTSNFITIGILSLLRNDDQRELFLSDIDGLTATAAEEVLRSGRMHMGLPVAGGGGLVPFVATEDVEIDGQLVAAGEAVLVDPAAAGHDPQAFETPEKMDITRRDNPHLTLSYGIHHCLGAPLARMEVQVGISEIFRRLPGLTPAGLPEIDHNNLTQPITNLPVTW